MVWMSCECHMVKTVRGMLKKHSCRYQHSRRYQSTYTIQQADIFNTTTCILVQLKLFCSEVTLNRSEKIKGFYFCFSQRGHCHKQKHQLVNGEFSFLNITSQMCCSKYFLLCFLLNSTQVSEYAACIQLTIFDLLHVQYTIPMHIAWDYVSNNAVQFAQHFQCDK